MIATTLPLQPQPAASYSAFFDVMEPGRYEVRADLYDLAVAERFHPGHWRVEPITGMAIVWSLFIRPARTASHSPSARPAG